MPPADALAEAESLAQARRAVSSTRQCGETGCGRRGFTEFETTAGGTWHIGGVCDYWAKPVLAAPGHRHRGPPAT